ncbi:hypothetical protein Tsubulata_017512 [Turnera subulata]|uniref:FCP1 homology domain-containing protein n=1 Tax=Turnera subulata TaxID=218843 RepID=A0A9Q0FK64_9ROSI|nr:hypothetical protein Tsubulata_017512 [Turnera subulata]
MGTENNPLNEATVTYNDSTERSSSIENASLEVNASSDPPVNDVSMSDVTVPQFNIGLQNSQRKKRKNTKKKKKKKQQLPASEVNTDTKAILERTQLPELSLSEKNSAPMMQEQSALITNDRDDVSPETAEMSVTEMGDSNSNPQKLSGVLNVGNQPSELGLVQKKRNRKKKRKRQKQEVSCDDREHGILNLDLIKVGDETLNSESQTDSLNAGTILSDFNSLQMKKKRKTRRRKRKQGQESNTMTVDDNDDGPPECADLHLMKIGGNNLISEKQSGLSNARTSLVKKDNAEDGQDVKVVENIVPDSNHTCVESKITGIENGFCIEEAKIPQLAQSALPGPCAVCPNKKLLIIDVNGLLVDIVSDVHDGYTADFKVSRKSVFKRPFCDDFLQFCLENFDVGVWSSRIKGNLDKVIEFLMGDRRQKLLFCWRGTGNCENMDMIEKDQSHCTDTGAATVENRDKPLFLKELKELWKALKSEILSNKGEYNESNTILLDDSPYKALRNPPHTAIFPYPYHYEDVEDSSLGPGGDLRVYLEQLAEAQNVQEFIAHNPFGQRPITESNPSWGFYRRLGIFLGIPGAAIAPDIPEDHLPALPQVENVRSQYRGQQSERVYRLMLACISSSNWWRKETRR